MSENRSVSFEYTAALSTTPLLPTVPGARQDGGMQVLRRQLRQGFGFGEPEDVEHPVIEVVAPSTGSGSLLALVKNVIDGLDEDDIILNDRQVWFIDARFDDTDTATTVTVWHDPECDRAHDGCEVDCPLAKRHTIRRCMLTMGAITETLARPVGAKPLLSPVGITVARDLDSYVTNLRDDVPNVVWDANSSVDALRSLVADGRPLRMILELKTDGFADIDNVTARLVHLAHILVHDTPGLDASDVWNASPPLEDLITEIRTYRVPDSGQGARITIEDTDSPSANAIADLRMTRELRSKGVTLPQIELAVDSPRLGKAKKVRGPR